jgi:putative transposase
VRFQFIQERKKEFPVQMMCDILQVSRSGYYAWKNRPQSQRSQQQEQLVQKIRQVHLQSRQTYGSPRVYRELKAAGVDCCENTVAKIMRKNSIRSKVRRRFVVHTTDSNHPHPVAQNRLEQCFQEALPNKAWCADITYIPTAEGWLYLAAVIDLCSRRIVGWAMADHLRASLCSEAMQMALKRRRPGPGLLHHSDRGVQYACQDYQLLLAGNGITCSMSRRGNCYDNAVMESFFGTLKRELIHHESYATRQQATCSIFEYIEVFYNRQRKHSSLGYLSPQAFEAKLN